MAPRVVVSPGGNLRADDDDHPGHYQQTNLVSDVSGLAATPTRDWSTHGARAQRHRPVWSRTRHGLSTVYNGSGAILSVFATVPNVAASPIPRHDGNRVQRRGDGVPRRTRSGRAFIFATEEGTISGWNSGTNAMLKVDNSGKAVYKA